MYRIEKIERENGGWVTVQGCRKAGIFVDVTLDGAGTENVIRANREKGMIEVTAVPLRMGENDKPETEILHGKVGYRNIRKGD